MGLLSWFRKAVTPPKVTTRVVLRKSPLNLQFQRIGGGLTPADVSSIIRKADQGYPATFVDLTNESRQKDGHFQSTCGTRDTAVGLVDLEFIEPKDATPDEKAACDLCRRVRDDFKNWPALIEHLTASYTFGHATSELVWEKTEDGLIIPREAAPIHPRDFIFSQEDGALRYRTQLFDQVGVDLLAENPGRIIQVQRRIVGDILAREGLARVIVWAALMRNWSLADWVALGEIGWKPWRIAQYEDGSQQEDIDNLVTALEEIGSTGIAAIPKKSNLNVEWPKGSSGSSQGSVHKELFDTLGREMSKAVLGQTTTVEAGPSGDRGGVQARDALRTDLREGDARAVASALRYQLFGPAVAVNIGADVRVPVPWFQTEESADQKAFSEAVKNLQDAGLRIPAKWVRDEVGMPEPLDGDEVLEPPKPVAVQVPPGAPIDEADPQNPDDEPIPPPEKAAQAKAIDENGDELPSEGRDYTDDVETSTKKIAARELSLTIASVVSAVQSAGSYQEAKAAILEKYRGMAPPRELARLLEGALLMTQAAGTLAVNEETPELTGAK